MLDSSSHTPANSEDHDRLNGWKEIAAFLGKGVRTAQRWEREYGMPVHRLGRDGGEIVWASRRELGAWMADNENRTRHDREPAGRPDAAQHQAPPPAATPELAAPLPSPPLPAPPPPERAEPAAWSRGLMAAATVAVLVIAGAYSWPLVKPLFVHGRPASIEAEGRLLWALDKDGRRLWSHSFDFPITVDREHGGPRPFGASWLLDDIDGDGKRELVFPSADPVNRSLAMTLTVFNEDGDVRFT